MPPDLRIAFNSLDDVFGAVSDAEAVRRICDGPTDQKIYRFACKWLARLIAAVHPRRRGRRLPLGSRRSTRAWFSTTMPWTGPWPNGSSPGS